MIKGGKIHFDFWPCGRGMKKGIWGSFPLGFERRMKELMGEGKYLHIFGGKVEGGDTVDIRPEVNPTFCCDARDLPIKDNKYDVVILDPPYSDKDFAKYGTKPIPAHNALYEGVRVAKRGGKIGFLHYMVPMTPKGTKRIAMVAVTCGPLMKIRCFSVFEKL